MSKESSKTWWRRIKDDPVAYAELKARRKKNRNLNPQPTDYEKTKAWRENNYAKYLLSTARTRAKKTGLEFNLTEDDIVIPTHCSYLGVALTYIQGGGNVDTNCSVDRIDNSKGYIKGNVEVISLLANRMKLKATKEQLITFAKNILVRYPDSYQL